MPANAGHIILPMETRLRLQAEWDEFDAAKKVWRRPWVYGERQRMVGRTCTVQNIPYRDGKGNVKHFGPVQAACLALQAGVGQGFDVIRVVTPGNEKTPGLKAIADIDFSVMKLMSLIEKDAIFFTEAINGRIRLEDEAANEMPREWKVSPDGILAPE